MQRVQKAKQGERSCWCTASVCLLGSHPCPNCSWMSLKLLQTLWSARHALQPRSTRVMALLCAWFCPSPPSLWPPENIQTHDHAPKSLGKSSGSCVCRVCTQRVRRKHTARRARGRCATCPRFFLAACCPSARQCCQRSSQQKLRRLLAGSQ